MSRLTDCVGVSGNVLMLTGRAHDSGVHEGTFSVNRRGSIVETSGWSAT